MDWWNDHKELAEVARMLVAAERLNCIVDGGEGDDLLDFLEKPWKWEVDRDLWIGAGRPTRDDPGWALFVDHLERDPS